MKLDKKIQEFFKIMSLNGTSRLIFATSNGATDMHYCYTLEDAIQKTKTNNSDAYFVCNPATNMKESGVTHLNCNFVDLDAGRDAEGNYLSANAVEKFKTKARSGIKRFPLKPTYVIETRNGYHCYWVYKTPLKPSVTFNLQWKETQAKIIKWFSEYGSDEIVGKPNQLLRVPGSMWNKRWSDGKRQYPAFLTKITQHGNKSLRYKYNDIKATVNGIVLDNKSTINNPFAVVAGREVCGFGSYTKKTDVNSNLVNSDLVPIYDNPSYTAPLINPTPTTISHKKMILADSISVLKLAGANYLANELQAISDNL